MSKGQEKWIPGLHSMSPLVRLPTTNVEMVQDLFVPGARVWDERIVRNSFMVLEASEVLKIKPSSRLQEDVMAWALERNGVYSIKFAYRLLKEEQEAI
jgi:hypothetical protein